MSNHLTTGVLVDCPCGATGVPMAWGGNDGGVRLYKHAKGVAWAGKATRGDKCGGPRDLFLFLLREAELMMTGPESRVMTQAEQAVADEFGAGLDAWLAAGVTR